MGTRPDEQIALLLRRTRAAVVTRRRKLGNPNHASRVRHPWTADQEKLLGSLPDQAVAELLARTASSVAIHRQRLGIPGAKQGT